jgi:hypothetical protein
VTSLINLFLDNSFAVTCSSLSVNFFFLFPTEMINDLKALLCYLCSNLLNYSDVAEEKQKKLEIKLSCVSGEFHEGNIE